jgi:flagellar biosynthesis protein FlhG
VIAPDFDEARALTLLASRPSGAPRTRQIWAIGGGKGGIGKSLLAASLGWQLARMGEQVVLVDADVGGANLHNYLGLPASTRTLGDVLLRRASSIEDALCSTAVPGLRLVSGTAELLSTASLGHLQKLRLVGQLRTLEADVVLVDLGAGTSESILDLFLLSDVSIVVVVPEPASVEVAYRFVKSALYRRLRAAAPTPEVRALVESAVDPRSSLGLATPSDLVDWVEAEDAGAAAVLRREVAAFPPRFVVNGVRSEAEVVVGHQLVAACRRHLGLAATYAGYVHHDDAVWQAVRRRRPFLSEAPGSRAAGEIRDLARRLARGEDLGHGY